MTVTFFNPGEIEPESFLIMGLNAKPNSTSPIGMFGTGLKYSIAVLLRTGHEVEINSGLRQFTFRPKPGNFRGTDTTFVEYHDSLGEHWETLGFTTDLGKHWEVWMAFRELFCNAQDEGGGTTNAHITPETGNTVIRVKGGKMDAVFRNRADFILEGAPIATAGGVEFHSRNGESKSIFYRGIKVGEFESVPLFTYNITGHMMLTEDRTIRWMSSVHELIGQATVALSNRTLQRAILTRPEGTPERSFTVPTWHDMPEQTETLLKEIYNKEPQKLNPSMKLRILPTLEREKQFTPVDPSPEELSMVQQAMAVLEGSPFAITFPISISASLGESVFGLVKDQRIYLSRMAIRKGLKQVIVTLAEEQIHLATGLGDGTRELQDYLLEHLVTYISREKGAVV